MTTFSTTSGRFLRFTALYWVAVFAALFLWSRDWAIVQATSTDLEHLFGLFGFCVFCAIALSAYWDWKETSQRSIKEAVTALLPFLVCLILLSLVVEFSNRSWDYKQYETAFEAIINQDNPYRSTRYLYPPFFADVMVLVYRASAWVLPWFGLKSGGNHSWNFVFYIHQSMLLFSILGVYALSIRFASRSGFNETTSVLLVSALFVFNIPLLRTISYNQVNFYVLAAMLGAMLAVNRSPFLAGTFITLGGLIKLYPFALAAPLFGLKKWKALAGMALSGVAIVAIETNFFRNLIVWKQFVLFYPSFPMEFISTWFRNSSPLSLIQNTVDFLGLPSATAIWLFMLSALTVLAWFAYRFFQRERLVRSSIDTGIPPDIYRSFGHLVDFSVLSLLITPLAWEHHYVIAIPLAIWTAALRYKDSPWPVVVALVLVFAVPVFNVYPFSYLRLAGVIILLVLSAPGIRKAGTLAV